MSSGVYAWDAARFLVDARRRGARSTSSARRPRPGRALLELDARLVVQPSALLDRDPALMSWHRGVYVGARHGVSNSFLTASELDFVKAGMWMAHLFVRKVSLLEHNGTVGLLDAIDAGAAAGCPGGGRRRAARAARPRRRGGGGRRGARRGDRRRAVGDDARPRDGRGAAQVGFHDAGLEVVTEGLARADKS